MKRRLFKTMAAVLAIAAAAAGPVRGQNANVSWVLTPYGDLQTGDTVVIVDKTSERALPNNNGSSAAPSAVEIELSGDQNALTEVPAATLKWVVVIDNGNYLFRKPGTDDYLYNTTTNNGVRVSTYSDDSKFTFEPGGPYSVPFLKNTINNRYIGVYNDQDWRCYTSTSINIGNTVTAFYKRTVAAPAPAVPHTVRFAEGMSGWQVQDVTASASATAPAVLQNVMAGDSLVVTAPAALPGKVKSVKAVKYVAPAATVATAPTATAAIIEVGSTAALVNAGAASGGSMMYAVTATNTQPASTADFSDAVPTAQGRTAGTYYVWYYAKADADHSDSEIAGPVSVTVTSTTTTVTWNSTALSAMQMNVMSGSQSRTQDDVTVTVTSSGEPMDFGSIMGLTGTGNFVFSTELGNITQIVISFSDMGNWFEANAGWPYELYSYEAGTFTWSGTPASSVTLSGDGGSVIFGITSIVFTIQPNN